MTARPLSKHLLVFPFM